MADDWRCQCTGFRSTEELRRDSLVPISRNQYPNVARQLIFLIQLRILRKFYPFVEALPLAARPSASREPIAIRCESARGPGTKRRSSRTGTLCPIRPVYKLHMAIQKPWGAPVRGLGGSSTSEFPRHGFRTRTGQTIDEGAFRRPPRVGHSR